MSKPLQIGNLSFKNDLVAAPLAGVSSTPYRELVWQYSKAAFAYTEMISCKTILYQPKLLKRFVQKSPNEGPLCVQISGSDVAEVKEAVKIVEAHGADLIDLNCGCPVKKIRSRHCGSKLLSTPSKIYQIIKAMKDSSNCPVSIKIRVDGVIDNFNEDVKNAINDAGADFVTVHGRHWTENYDTPVRYEQISYFVNALNMPVIGNGDIACLSSYKKIEATGCSGAMIGRALVGQPWLIAKIRDENKGISYISPSIAEIGEIFLTHVTSLAKLLQNDKFAIINARKFAKYYARPLENKEDFCKIINKIDTLDNFTKACNDYFR